MQFRFNETLQLNTNFFVQISELIVEQPRAQAAKTQVRRQSCLTGQQRLGRHFRPAEACNPGFALEVSFQTGEGLALPAHPHWSQ